MHLKIKSKYADSGAFDFWAPDGGGYVRIISVENPGTLGRQICYGGDFSGSTISARTEGEFTRLCRGWLADYRRWRRAES
jgi:hypothetical protein